MTTRPTNYQDIVYNLGRILLDAPDWNATYANDNDLYVNRTTGMRERFIVTGDDYGMADENGLEVDATDPNITHNYNRAVVWDPESPEGFLCPCDAVIRPRYGKVRPEPQFVNNQHVIYWEVELDILVSGSVDPYDPDYRWNPTKDRDTAVGPTGIYSPKRGLIVDRVIKQLLKYPTLRHQSTQDPTSTSYAPMSDVILANLWDSTDLNYWTLLWSYGLPQSYLGWWPTTLVIEVRQNYYPGVRYF